MAIEKEKIVVLGLMVQDGRVLIVHRTNQDVGKDGVVLAWGFPGGKVEPGERLEDAVVREVHEETGYKVAVASRVSERVHPDFPVRAVYFDCRLLNDVLDSTHDAGTQEVRWVKATELEGYFGSALDAKVINFLSVL